MPLTRNYTNFNFGMLIRICFCKAFRKTSSRKRTVRIYGTVHNLPTSVSQNLELSTVSEKRLSFKHISSYCHIRLTNNQKRMKQNN